MVETSDTVALTTPFSLEDAGELSGARVAYRTWGTPRPDEAVVLLHGLSRSQFAMGDCLPLAYSPHGWAEAILGRTSRLSHRRLYLVAPNLLGSPFGSTSPASPGRPDLAGARFPRLSVGDQARAVQAVLAHLGIQQARAVLGFSLGGMVALRHAALFPGSARSVATFMGPAALSGSARQRLAMVARSLEADPALRGESRRPAAARALERTRLTGLRELYSRDWLLSRHDDPFAAEHAFEAEAVAFARLFDPFCYLSLLRCMSGCDQYGSLDGIDGRVLVVACSSDQLATPTAMRDTYHALSAAGGRVRFMEVASDAGHRTPYLEPEKLAAAVVEALG